MDNEVQVETVETQKEQVANVETTKVVEEAKKVKSTEVVRELAKKFGVNLFEEGGLQALEEKLNAKETEYTNTQTRLKELTEKETLFAQKEQEYQVKLEALGMGFTADNLEEVLALAKVHAKDNPISDGLKIVKEKYGKVFANNVDIGLLHNDGNKEKPDIAKTEQEKYLSQSPAVRAYNKQQEKYKRK